MFEGRLAEAALALSALLKQRPRDPAVRFLLGLRERAAGKGAAAAAHLRRALRLSPRDARLHLYLAEALLRAGRSAACLSALRRGLKVCPAPSDAEGLLLRYRLAFCAFDAEAAAAAGEALLDLGAPVHGLAYPVFHEHFELFPRPAAYRAARERAWAAAEKKRPGSPWLAYFRLLTLEYPRYSGERRRRDFAAVRAADAKRYGWMRAEAARRAAEGDEGLDGADVLTADRAAAKASGLRLAETGERRL